MAETYRIEVLTSGVVIADGLGKSAPAVRLDEGRVAVRGEKRPADLAPGGSTTVVYPLDVVRGEKRREIVCRVTRTDAPEGSEQKAADVCAGPDATFMTRGGRRPVGSGQ